MKILVIYFCSILLLYPLYKTSQDNTLGKLNIDSEIPLISVFGGVSMLRMLSRRHNYLAELTFWARLLRSRSGAAAVEFAFVGPMMVVLLLGIMSYGGYFWLAHSVQQLANDAARAAVAGLSASERQSLAQATISAELPNYAFLTTSGMVTSVNTQTTAMTVSIAYNASQTPFFALGGLVPMPSSTITRTATIKLAGY